MKICENKKMRLALSSAALTVALVSSAQTGQTLTGTVLDPEGEPLIGAMVKVEGTKIVATTDLDGKFSITAPAGKKIEITYVGYEPQYIKVAPGQTTYSVTMTTQQLDEVVVVGYGTQKKSEVTGSISQVKADAIKNFSPAWLSPNRPVRPASRPTSSSAVLPRSMA